MSGWKGQITTTSPVWTGLTEYIDERIAELTGVCIMPESSTESIRAAQAGIVELTRIALLPQIIAAETNIRNQAGSRKEY